MRGMKFKESFCDSVFLKNGMKKGTKRRLKRGLAVLLAFLMLPFSDFVGIGIREVFADTQAESVTVKEDYVLTEDLRVNDLVVEEGTLNLNLFMWKEICCKGVEGWNWAAVVLVWKGIAKFQAQGFYP